MKKIILLLILFMVSACGVAPTEVQPIPILASTASVEDATALPAAPTETQLPPLELPAFMENAPALLAWDGVPTYPGDSNPGYFFRVYYNPAIWALTFDNYGFPAIAHRGIEYCVVTPTSGGGLPADMRVDHEIRRINGIAYEVGAVYSNDGVKQFVSYIGGDANIYTGFQVSFHQDSDLCLQEAEVVFATLISVPESQATPAAPAP